MVIRRTPNPSPSPDRFAEKVGRGEGPPPADPQLTPDPDQAKRPGGPGKGARRR
jgi:hypothetical protein